MKVRLRPAAPGDSERVFRWRNDRRLYRLLFADGPVARPGHDRWFASRLADSRSRLLIALAGGRPAGHIRLDGIRNGRAEIGVLVAPEAQGRGAGAAAIVAAEAPARRLGVKTLVARVRVENAASAIAFLKAGYRFERRARVNGHAAYVLEKSL